MQISNLFGLITGNHIRAFFSDERKISERLSSGLRINRAADDPSGLAISSTARAQIGGLDTAIQNIQDAIKMIRTMDGSLAEINDLLQRGRDIAVRAANQATWSASDLQAMQLEVDGITAAINQIANTTTYNSKYIINGGAGQTFMQTTQADFQAGTYDPNKIDLVSAPGSIKLQPLDWSTQTGYGTGTANSNEYHMSIYLTGYVDNGNGTITATLNIDGCRNGGGTQDYKGTITLGASAVINSITNVSAGTAVTGVGTNVADFSTGANRIRATNSNDVDAQVTFTVDKDDASWVANLSSGPGSSVKFYYGGTQVRNSILSYSQSGYFTDMTSSATFRSSAIDTTKVGGTATLTWNGSTTGGTNMMMAVYEAAAAGGPWTALGMYESGSSFEYTQQYLMVEATLTSAGIAFGSPSLDDFTIQVVQGSTVHVDEMSDQTIAEKTISAVNATAAGLGVANIDVTSLNKTMKLYDTQAEWQSGIVSSTGIDYLSEPGVLKLNSPIVQNVSSQNPGAARCYMDIESATARPDGKYDVQMSVNMYGYDPDGAGSGNNASCLNWRGTFSITDGSGTVTFDQAWAIDADGGTPVSVPLPTTGAATNDGVRADGTILANGGAVSAGPFSTITFDFGTAGAKDGFGVTFTCDPDAIITLTWNNDGIYNAGGGNTRTLTGDDYVSADIMLGATTIAQNVGAGAGNYTVTRRLAEYTPVAAPTGTFTTGPVYFGPSSSGQLSGVTNGGNTLFEVQESMDGIGGWTTILAPGAGNSFTTSAGGNYVRVIGTLNGTPAVWSANPYGYTQSTTPEIDQLRIEKSVSPITEYNDAINSLNDIRGELGILERELNSILNTISDEKINLIAANSRILDADYAREYTDMTRANIIGQSAIAISAQGDAVAKGVLNLFDETGVGVNSLKTPEELMEGV